MKKEMKNWNGTIELRPHWSSHTQAPKSPPEPLPATGRTIIFRPSFQGIHLYMVYTGAEIAARCTRASQRAHSMLHPSDWTSET